MRNIRRVVECSLYRRDFYCPPAEHVVAADKTDTGSHQLVYPPIIMRNTSHSPSVAGAHPLPVTRTRFALTRP
jgi:hypothetical protein